MELFGDLSGVPESEEFERKSSLDPTNPRDMLGLVADIAAMANTRGGRILVGTAGVLLSEGHVKLFDSARLDDKVNSFLEPNVGGIRSAILAESFLLIDVEKSINPPHVFKREGNYTDAEKGQAYIFRSRDILVRHSSKTERAARSDLDRMFSERQQNLLEKVRMVFEAPADAQIHIVEGAGVPVRIDPDAPGARPIYDVLTSSPFRDLQQELIGALKSWKTSRQLLNETQIMKAYLAREQVLDAEIFELLLRSCWERRIPGFWWAAHVGVGTLPQMLQEEIESDAYPGSTEALKISSLLPRGLAAKIFRVAEESARKSVKGRARRLEPVLRARTRKYEKLIELLYPSQKLIYLVPGGVKTVEFERIDEPILDEIIGTVLAGQAENRSVFKAAESVLYATKVAELPFPVDSELASETGLPGDG